MGPSSVHKLCFIDYTYSTVDPFHLQNTGDDPITNSSSSSISSKACCAGFQPSINWCNINSEENTPEKIKLQQQLPSIISHSTHGNDGTVFMAGWQGNSTPVGAVALSAGHKYCAIIAMCAVGNNGWKSLFKFYSFRCIFFAVYITSVYTGPTLYYRKSLNTSRTSNTSRGSDLIVLIEAGPWIEAGPQTQIHAIAISVSTDAGFSGQRPSSVRKRYRTVNQASKQLAGLLAWKQNTMIMIK